MEKLSSVILVPGATKVGDHCSRAYMCPGPYLWKESPRINHLGACASAAANLCDQDNSTGVHKPRPTSRGGVGCSSVYPSRENLGWGWGMGGVMIQESENWPILAFYGTFVRKSGFALRGVGVNGAFRARKLSIG